MLTIHFVGWTHSCGKAASAPNSSIWLIVHCVDCGDLVSECFRHFFLRQTAPHRSKHHYYHWNNLSDVIWCGIPSSCHVAIPASQNFSWIYASARTVTPKRPVSLLTRNIRSKEPIRAITIYGLDCLFSLYYRFLFLSVDSPVTFAILTAVSSLLYVRTRQYTTTSRVKLIAHCLV